MATIRSALLLPEGTTGAAVYFEHQFMGLDLFDKASTLEYFWSSLIDSYALDWLACGDGVPAGGCHVGANAVLEELSTEWEAHPSPGEGEDCRLRTPHLTASCLLWERTRAVHLQVFPVSPEPGPGAARPKIHRRYGPR